MPLPLPRPSGTEFRLWRREAVRPALGAAATWSCAAVAGYRGEPLSAPAFSPDGSLLALAVGSGAVALWDVSQLSLVSLLPLPPPSPGGAKGLAALAFLPHSQALVAASPDRLLLLDVLTLGVRWAATLPVSALAVDPRSDHWAACVAAPGSTASSSKAGSGETHAVVLFEGCSRRPKRAWTLHAAAGWAPPLQLLFVPPPAGGSSSSGSVGSKKCSPLLVLSPSREYILLGLDAETTPAAATAAAGSTEQAATAAAAEASLGFAARHGLDTSMLQVPAPRAASAKGIAVATAAAGQGSARPFFFSDTPSHMLPPLQELAPKFLLQALHKVGDASRDT